eukprot:scaffold54446_cov17-Prasinocladus_malaysianus.AAC.3
MADALIQQLVWWPEQRLPVFFTDHYSGIRMASIILQSEVQSFISVVHCIANGYLQQLGPHWHPLQRKRIGTTANYANPFGFTSLEDWLQHHLGCPGRSLMA